MAGRIPAIVVPFDILMVGAFPADPAVIQGGVEASVLGLARALAQRADVRTIKVFALPTRRRAGQANAMAEGKLSVCYLDIPWRYYATSLLHLKSIVLAARRACHPVVHLHGTGLLQLALAMALRRRSVPVIWTLHGLTEKETWQRFTDQPSAGNYLRYLLYKAVERASLATIGTVIVDTPYVRKAIPTARGKIHVIPQGVCTDATVVEAAGRALLVVSVGVMEARKGHHLTLAAFARIHHALPGLRLAVVGAVTDPAYLQSLQLQAASLGIADAVAFHPDAPRRDMLALLRQAHVFALHSREESQGIALCEALAHGLPIVSTKVGGIPHVVTEGEDGFLLAHGDIDGFADALLRLLTQDALRLRMSRNALRASRRFSWQDAAEKVMRVYQGVATPGVPALGSALHDSVAVS